MTSCGHLQHLFHHVHLAADALVDRHQEMQARRRGGCTCRSLDRPFVALRHHPHGLGDQHHQREQHDRGKNHPHETPARNCGGSRHAPGGRYCRPLRPSAPPASSQECPPPPALRRPAVGCAARSIRDWLRHRRPRPPAAPRASANGWRWNSYCRWFERPVFTLALRPDRRPRRKPGRAAGDDVEGDRQARNSAATPRSGAGCAKIAVNRR